MAVIKLQSVRVLSQSSRTGLYTDECFFRPSIIACRLGLPGQLEGRSWG